MTNNRISTDKTYVPDWSELTHSDGKGVLDAGFYPSFQGLWHLKALGVADDIDNFSSTVWERLNTKDPVCIALLDTAVAWEHPNLVGAIDLGLMRDFQSSNDGVFVVDPKAPEDIASRERLLEDVRNLPHEDPKPISATARQAILNKPPLPLPESVGPGTHGTAVAGLIGARPAEVNVVRPVRVWSPQASSDDLVTDRVPLAYSGVNPFCRIVPISTTAAPDPDMILAALQYARLIKAQVLVIAAAWEDTHRAEKGDNLFNPEGATWKHVEAELAELGKSCIILCSAGNSGRDALAYPATLSDRIDGLYAVTACLADGKPVTYTATPTRGHKTLATLGGEAPRYDRDVDVVDPWAIKDFDPGRPKPKKEVPAERLISLDPPGHMGANPSPYRYTPKAGGNHLEIGSLYAEFTGTSAAVAVAAGLVSLALQLPRPEGGASMAGQEKGAGVSFTGAHKTNLFNMSLAEQAAPHMLV